MESMPLNALEGPCFNFSISKENILSSVKSLIKGDTVMDWSDQYKMIKMFNP